MESNGFSRLTEGALLYVPNARCNWNSWSDGAFYASMMTGATPSLHGIVGSQFYSTVDDQVISCVSDPRFEGINTRMEVSPRMLQAGTLSDQLKMQFPGSRVYSIARDAESAIMMGGHLADAVVWIDGDSGVWCTSKYYEKGLPLWALQQNSNNAIKGYIGTPWQPMGDISTYHYNAHTKNTWNLARPIFQETESVVDVLNSPFVNDAINKVALRALRDDYLGTDESPDLLMIEYSLRSQFADGSRSAEYEDAMVRLDANLKSLLDAIDISVGLENTVVVLTATPQKGRQMESNDKRMPSAQFHNERAMALLNAYLMAIYGQGNWVKAYHNRQIYLNQELIENQSVVLSDIQDKTASFMTLFQTVLTATAAHTLAMPTSTDAPTIVSRQANTQYKHRSGDVVLTLLPGATDLEDAEATSFNPITVPLLIYAPDMQLNGGSGDFKVTDLCPTLARLLWITAPSAATEVGR